nr:MAG TPA: hypothetical protein [Caudoviricetes sp.]
MLYLSARAEREPKGCFTGGSPFFITTKGMIKHGHKHV